MIQVKDQQELLISISRELKKKIEVYAIGGTAMMFHLIKDTTKDIDLVFNSKEDRDEFERAAISLGYKKIDSTIVYGTDKQNQPRMLTRGKDNSERFDLFNYNIISFVFSEKMRMRAEKIFAFGENLILKIADPHDLILMKCATDRIKDKDDAKSIIETQTIDYDILIEEAKLQVKLGINDAIFELGEFLESLKNDLQVNVPQDKINILWDLLSEQVKAKKG